MEFFENLIAFFESLNFTKTLESLKQEVSSLTNERLSKVRDLNIQKLILEELNNFNEQNSNLNLQQEADHNNVFGFGEDQLKINPDFIQKLVSQVKQQEQEIKDVVDQEIPHFGLAQPQTNTSPKIQDLPSFKRAYSEEMETLRRDFANLEIPSNTKDANAADNTNNIFLNDSFLKGSNQEGVTHTQITKSPKDHTFRSLGGNEIPFFSNVIMTPNPINENDDYQTRSVMSGKSGNQNLNDSFGPKPPSFEDLSNLDHSAHLIDEEEEVKEARLESDGVIRVKTGESNLSSTSKTQAKKHGYPEKAKVATEDGPINTRYELLVKAEPKIKSLQSYGRVYNLKESINTPVDTFNVYLADDIKHPCSKSKDYPRVHNKEILDYFNLKIIISREKTCIENKPDLSFQSNDFIAGKYMVIRQLGKGGFSNVYAAQDIETGQLVCLKMIIGKKACIDQSLEELKMLRLISANGDPDTHYFLNFVDSFYFREHLFIVTEQLGFDLYRQYQSTSGFGGHKYFTLDRIRTVATQIFKNLEFIHGLGILHCDIKPENILFKSTEPCEVRVIDFGSCCFLQDEPTFYMQTRPYRAPELLLGCSYDHRVDVWSVGCVLVELYSGITLFNCPDKATILAKMLGLFGPFPEWMLDSGKYTRRYFTKDLIPYTSTSTSAGGDVTELLVSNIKPFKEHFIHDDPVFIDFMTKLLQPNPNLRYTASQALLHPFLMGGYSGVGMEGEVNPINSNVNQFH